MISSGVSTSAFNYTIIIRATIAFHKKQYEFDNIIVKVNVPGRGKISLSALSHLYHAISINRQH